VSLLPLGSSLAQRVLDVACGTSVLAREAASSVGAAAIVVGIDPNHGMLERGVRPRRIDAATRISLVLLARRFDWRSALVIVRPVTLLRWHRACWRLFWRLKSRPGRVHAPIRRMAWENPSWGEERIANELLLKLQIRVSPRTVRKYMPKRPWGQPRGNLRWSTFLKNHASAILACDFSVAITATFRVLYVFVVIEHGTRHLADVNVTAHPSADWTLQQLREVVADTDHHRYLIHDRDRILPSTWTIRSGRSGSGFCARRSRLRRQNRSANA